MLAGDSLWKASQVAVAKLAQTQGHHRTNQVETSATNPLTMSHDGSIKEASHPLHPSQAALPWLALRFIKEVIVSDHFGLRVAMLIACLVAVKVLLQTFEHLAAEHRERWAKTNMLAKRNLASGAKAKPCLRDEPSNRHEELTAQQLVVGREFFDRELHPAHPDLYEPSPFHEDVDVRRVVKGGE
eukprot:TRINITY_DN3473_c0_g1_i2.p1 TRINITY_DN3473_c0_g1~~TRINITY_DN3473_c0_g1_i2.p1  ORF type:complete len:185 (-),score=28.04 TRINITY_DN3473_c0_g1_i2:262-816(-)